MSTDEVDRQEPRIATITLDKKEPLKSILQEFVGKNWIYAVLQLLKQKVELMICCL